VAGSAEESVEVVQADNEVDRLNDLIFQELLAFLAGDVHQSRRALGLILVARGFERVADHAVNIAEDVVFIVRGEDIRHVAAR
jgi:phosphate transport system protein